MKTLYFISGTMGVGKTTACQILKELLEESVFLDGDWCWDMHPFVVTEETKKMVLDNICHVLNNFLHCSQYQSVIFCWVMQEQAIIDEILKRLDTKEWNICSISLVCGEKELRQRLQAEVEAGRRDADCIDRSLKRLPMYDKLDTVKVDVSCISPQQAAQAIRHLGEKNSS